MQELGDTIEVTPATVIAWEDAAEFPTKKHIDAMAALAAKGPDAVVRRRRRSRATTPMAALADPELWRVVRKLAAHPELLRQVQKLAETWNDPAGES